MRTHVHVGEEAKRGITRGQEKVLGRWKIERAMIS